MKKIYAWIRHNSGICSSAVLACLLLVFAYSCQSVVVSMVHANRKVTRDELLAEVEAYLSMAEVKFKDLDRQDLVKNTIFNSIVDLVNKGSVTPVAIMTTISSILGVGAVIDNVRKRTHINTLKGETLNGKVKEEVGKIINQIRTPHQN